MWLLLGCEMWVGFEGETLEVVTWGKGAFRVTYRSNVRRMAVMAP